MTPRRLCDSCGIASWQSCVCDDDAGLDHPENPYIAAERRRTPNLAGGQRAVNGNPPALSPAEDFDAEKAA
jgi:hypothetical protein